MEDLCATRDETLEADMARGFSEKLAMKDEEKLELEAKIARLERELSTLRSHRSELSERIKKGEEELEREKRGALELEQQSARFKEEIRVLIEREQREKGEKDEWRRRCEELKARVLKLEEENSLKKLGQGHALGVIEISDSEDEASARKELKKKVVLDVKEEGSSQRSLQMMNPDKSFMDILEEGEEYSRHIAENALSVPTPKRKRGPRVVTSDSESEADEDDKVPIGNLKMRKIGEVIEGTKESKDIQESVMSPRRRLVRLRKTDRANTSTEGNATQRKLQYSNVEEDEDDSESEGESLGGFIVSGSDSQETVSGSGSHSLSEEEVDSDVNLGDVLADIRRGKARKKWEFEADMLSAFSNDPNLCLKAVCALYRQQTSEEQSIKATLVHNKRGFNHLDAKRGSLIAEFLTDGNPHGPLTKTVQHLEKYDHKGLDFCYNLARRYSKQLFMIYQNKEDPYFLPS
ncbi:uncharacterized protein [Typha angustifolia]|uniref:uncharacterized protein n=1 Tax=Typha angustifolia TaxID=59011 RepID=UPI003C2C40B1